jgi:hypothetical protein
MSEQAIVLPGTAPTCPAHMMFERLKKENQP